MQKVRFDEYLLPACPIRQILARISDKWSLLVLYTMRMRPDAMRFGDLRHAIPDISQKMLAYTLRTLEEDGYVSRKVYAEVPPRVEYSLTERAFSLMPHIDALIKWSEENMKAILDDRRKQPAGDV